MYRLEGEVALVTGASRGIGRAIAIELGRLGAHVVGTATSEASLDRLGAALQEENFRWSGFILDVGETDSVDALFERLDGSKLVPTVLVNNAGITRDNLLVRLSHDDWESVINTDLTSLYRMCRRCVRQMMKARRGRIVNIASVVGATGNPGQVNYAAAKAGMLGFTRSLAREIASRGITVNAVAPGFIETDMTEAVSDAQREALRRQIPLGQLGRPEDVARTVAFLVSPAARYITGQTLHVNGGMHMAG